MLIDCSHWPGTNLDNLVEMVVYLYIVLVFGRKRFNVHVTMSGLSDGLWILLNASSHSHIRPDIEFVSCLLCHIKIISNLYYFLFKAKQYCVFYKKKDIFSFRFCVLHVNLWSDKSIKFIVLSIQGI